MRHTALESDYQLRVAQATFVLYEALLQSSAR